jgi:glutamate synthase (ferredoxin)
MPEMADGRHSHCVRGQYHGIDKSYDKRVLEGLLHNSIYKGEKTVAVLPVTNKDRTIGTYVGGRISRIYADRGLMEDTITLYMKGSAGQSFGAFIPKGMTLFLEGDCNDYMGKGLSGGKIVLRCPKEADYRPEENIIAGNVAFYGATGGEAYINGIAGERFCVRNSGVHAVVEGVGDHGCEYMTGGRVVVLGKTGRNFAAGMSGGIAYVYDDSDGFREKVNMEMVLLEKLSKNDEADWLRSMIKKHYSLTGSETAEKLLDRWEDTIEKFVRVIPVDYKRMMETIQNEMKNGRKSEEAELAAFRKHVV